MDHPAFPCLRARISRQTPRICARCAQSCAVNAPKARENLCYFAHQRVMCLYVQTPCLGASIQESPELTICADISVDLRDAVGDRLFLSDGFRRDGTKFDIGQATTLKEHAEALSVRQAVAQSRNSRGFFDVLLRRAANRYKPTYNYQPDGSACRVYGTITAKKVTGELRFCDVCVNLSLILSRI